MRGVLKRQRSEDSAADQDDYPALLTGLDELVDGLRQAGLTAWADLAESTRAAAPLEIDNAQVVLEHHRTMLGNARHDAARIRAAAEKALEDTISEQRRLLDRDTLTAAANEAAEQIVAKARRQAEQIVAEARRRAEQTGADAAGSESRPNT